MTDHLTHVGILNFQSIAEADFHPGPLTVIVGDNDAGKTAIMRAIRAACFNGTGSANIRRGEEETAVLLEFADDIAIRWRKQRGGGAEYRLWVGDDETDFSKLGAAVPPEIQAALRFAEIEVSKDFRIQPQFHPQEEYYFLLDRPEGQAARALAKMTKLDIVVEAQQAIRVDLRRAKGDLANATANIAQYTEDLIAFHDLDDDIAAIDRAEAMLHDASDAAEALDDMRAAWDAVRDIQAELADARAVPSAEAISDLKGEYNAIRAMLVAQREYTEAATMLANFTTDYAALDIAGLRQQVEELDAATDAYRAHYIASSKVIDIEDEIRALEERTSADRKRWRELKTCPECGQPLENL